MCMKLKITEQQVKGLVLKLNEQEEIDMAKEMPNLSKLAKFMGSNKSIDSPEPSSDVSTPIESVPYIPTGNQMMHPLGHKSPISSQYGLRDINVKGATKDHKGIDIPTASNSPVYAPLDGIVSASRDTTPNACGGFIKLDHNSIETKFCHLSRMVVSQGEQVKKGQIIGYSGGGPNDPHPGISTGPHLHYEILNNSGIAMNPSSVQPNLA